MKKYVCLIICILATISFSGCAVNNDTNIIKSPSPAPAAQASPAAEALTAPEPTPKPSVNSESTAQPASQATPEPLDFTTPDWLELGEDAVMLTDEEINWFNTEFFNKGINIHNQFLSSTYDCPEDINLNELFYNGTWINGATQDNDIITAGEISAYIARYGCWIPELDINKLTTGDMDKVLMENMGLTLDETNKVCLTYGYLPETDAYYHTHGGTNYKEYDIIYGYREKEQIYLFYSDSKLIRKSDEEVKIVDSVYRVVLYDTGNGYLFKSNTQLVQAGTEVQYVAYAYTKVVSKQNLEIQKVELIHDTDLSADSFEEAVANIEAQGSVGSYTRIELDKSMKYIWPEYGELVCGEIGGIPHGSMTQLCFVFYDGTVYKLPLPAADGWGTPVSYGNDDGQFSIASVSDELLVYYVYFSGKMIYQDDTTETGQIIHEVGTYTYYFIPATKDCYLTIDN
jgi:hypothetical protein